MITKARGVDGRIKVRPRAVDGPPATVTVVISCFNYGRFLTQAVRSAVTQEGVIVDVVIVDDASTDDSLATARSLERAYERVHVLPHTKNQGVVQAFNSGAALATGEYVVRLDADDILVPGSLSRATQLGRTYPSVGLIYGHPLHFEGDVLPSPRMKPTGWTIWSGIEWLSGRCKSGTNVITSPEVVMRRSTMKELGPQAPLRHTHDMEYWLRFAAFSDVGYIHGADQAWHREHGASLSAMQVDPLVDLRERADAFGVFFSGVAGSRPHVRALEPVATAALAREAVGAAQHEVDRGLPDPKALEAYLDIACELDATLGSSPGWLRASRARDLTPRRFDLGSLVRRARGRLKSDVEWHRWHRNGVY